MDYNEWQRQEAYKNRIGKVYGMFEVIKVETDETSSRGQKWTMRCVKCGKIRITRSGNDYVKGKCGSHCSCMNKANQPKAIKERIPYSEKMKIHYGKIYRSWRVIEYKDGQGMEVECVNCGRRVLKPATQVLKGTASKCVCEFKAKYDESYIGMRYGRLVVESIVHKNIGGKNRLMFNCLCDCGNHRLARPVYLEKGNILCCGEKCVYKNENNKLVEGNSKEMLYKKWQGMIQRCCNPKNPAYYGYGSRGIKVCDEWKNDYVAFRKWSYENGYNPNIDRCEMSIDRINPDGNYEPSNCRFISISENARRGRHFKTFRIDGELKKKRPNAIEYEVEFDGMVLPIRDACMLANKCLQTILYRIRKMGMTPQEAFDKPTK